ncbi:MAG: pilus assembly protein PilM [Candidatus Omnitrophota bacterium]
MKIPSLCRQFLAKKTEDFVALNLGNYSLKGFVVRDNAVVDYFIEPRADLAVTLKKIWESKKITTDRVKVSVKDTSCLVRYFPFLKMDKKKMKEALLYELAKHIPFPPDDVYFDFAPLEDVGSSEVFLLLAIAKKDFINHLLDVFEKENRRLIEINLDSVCLINFFLKAYGEEARINSCLLDVGHHSSSLTIIRKGVPCLTRDLVFSTKDIFQVIANVKGITLIDAEKWLFSLTNAAEFLELAQGSIDNLCGQVKSSFDYFEVNRGERIERMYITGGLVQAVGIETPFKETLGVEAMCLGNFEKAGISFTDSAFVSVRNTFSAAAGLVV